MNNHLAPKFHRKLGSYWVLWFKTVNTYTVIDENFKHLLNQYLEATNEDDFISKLQKEQPNLVTNASAIFRDMETYLKDCNRTFKEDSFLPIKRDNSKRIITKQFQFKSIAFRIHAESQQVLNLVYPALAHLETTTHSSTTNTEFDIYTDDTDMFLFKNDNLLQRVPKHDYHLIQGKFIHHVLCTLHAKADTDWIGSLHACTIANGNTSVLLMGSSGKGKSTLSTLLAAQGFELVADDLSALLADNQHIYYNPSAISLKEGSFEAVRPLVPHLDIVPTVSFKAGKGPMKYVAFAAPKKTHYPCKAIILVNYTKHASTQLDPITIAEVLETLIPESWLSPNPTHAKQFLDWLQSLKFYKLTYSDTSSVVTEVSQLFEDLESLNL